MLGGVDLGNRYDALRAYGNLNKPWYLWRMHFEKNEDLIIVVRYRLPNGATKISHFFNYLLSTGAGWKGNIRDAKVIVSLNEVAEVQMIDIKPKLFYKREGNEITWHFKNLKPSLKNDIYLDFETSKGVYKAHEALTDSLTPAYVDGKKIKHSAIDFDKVGSYHVIINSSDQNYKLVILTKAYILKKFKRGVKRSDPAFWHYISRLSVKTFENSKIRINGERTVGRSLYEKLNRIDSTNIVTGKTKKLASGKMTIIITTEKPLPSDESIFQSAPQL